MSPYGVTGFPVDARAPSHRPRDRRRVCQLGATTVEFALVVPLLVTVVFGTVELGRLVCARASLAYAAIQGARTAAGTASTTTLSSVQNTVIACAPMLGLTGSNVTVELNGVTATSAGFAARAAGDSVKVTVTYQFTPAISVPAVLTARTMTENNTTTVGSP